MSEVGCLGDVIFRVDSNTVQTFADMRWSGSSKIAEHSRIGHKSLAEFVGADADKISFNMMISTTLGVDVDKEIEKIRSHAEKGTTLPLVVGRKTYGKYRWLINAYSAQVISHDSDGKISTALVTVNIVEYLKN